MIRKFFITTLFIVCLLNISCYAKTITNESINQVIINAVECNKVNIKKSDNSSFKFEYDKEYYKIESKVDNNKLIIDVTQIKQYNPFPIRKNDIYIPVAQLDNIKINSNSAGISVEDIDTNLDITNVDGGTYLELPDNFSSTLNFDGENSTCGVVIDENIKGFDFTLDVDESKTVLPKQWKYKNDTKQFEYSQGTDISSINIKGKNLNVHITNENETY